MNVIYSHLSKSLRQTGVQNFYPLVFLKNKYSSFEVGTKPYFDDLIAKNKVVVFMKGTPEEPRCGFSNAVVQILRMHGVQYDAHNVLEDEKMRQGIKEYSDWPTIPQIFFNRELIGGCDIFIQMHQEGELVKELSKIGIKSSIGSDSEKS